MKLFYPHLRVLWNMPICRFALRGIRLSTFSHCSAHFVLSWVNHWWCTRIVKQVITPDLLPQEHIRGHFHSIKTAADLRVLSANFDCNSYYPFYKPMYWSCAAKWSTSPAITIHLTRIFGLALEKNVIFPESSSLRLQICQDKMNVHVSMSIHRHASEIG